VSVPYILRVTEPILTDRLLLRTFEKGDLEDLYDIQSRPDVTRFLYWEPRTRSEVGESLVKKMASVHIETEGVILSLAVTEKSGGPVIGDLNLIYESAAHQHAEFGYVFHPAVHGQGFATEAARALVDLAFTNLKLHRVTAALDARNIRSAALLERLGLRREAHLIENEWVKGEWTDEAIYAVLAGEWVSSRLGGE
jgi:RimJ/RimL family protein N-acetyltransferase